MNAWAVEEEDRCNSLDLGFLKESTNYALEDVVGSHLGAKKLLILIDKEP
jgi:hypothetical protein